MNQNETLPAALPPVHRASLLVVEDDLHIRRMNTTALVEVGYLVDTAEDGVAAWELLKTRKYQVLITDNLMPRMSGLELIKKVRAAQIPLPVILVSGTLPKEELAMLKWLHIEATVPKPYGLGDLLGTVKTVLAAPLVTSPVIPPELQKTGS